MYICICNCYFVLFLCEFFFRIRLLGMGLSGGIILEKRKYKDLVMFFKLKMEYIE